EELRTNLVVKVLAVRAELAVAVASGEQVVRVGLVELVAQVVPVELVARVAQEARAVSEEPAGQVAQEARGGLVVQVAQEGRAELVGREALAELELSRVEGLELVRAEAELALVPGAVAPVTKSVTAAHHRGLVAVPKAEDLAVVAETMHEPAAT